MKNLIWVTTILFLIACNDDMEAPTAGGAEYFVFGKFAGFCAGEQCVEIYKYEAGKIFEDQSDRYPDWTQGHVGDFIERTDLDGLTDQLDVIVRTLPSGLAMEANRVFGCPDCTDQGGIYIEIKDFGIDRIFWLFDNDQSEIPEEYQPLVSQIQSIVDSIE